MLSLLGTQLCGISDLLLTLDNTFELIEIEDSDKKEKDENEEDVKLFSHYANSLHLYNHQLAKNIKCSVKPSSYSLVTDTPPPELI